MICSKGNNRITCTCLRYLGKAFDCADHNMPQPKCFFYGVRGAPFEQLASYVDNKVHCNKRVHLKSFLPVTRGISQGFVVGPLLFLKYVEWYYKSLEIQYRFTVYYADYINLHFPGKSIKIHNKLRKLIIGLVVKYYE